MQALAGGLGATLGRAANESGEILSFSGLKTVGPAPLDLAGRCPSCPLG